MNVLQLTAHFSPNVGGVETHLSDLIEYLNKKNWKVFVLTYSPLTTQVKWKIFEKIKNTSVLRIPWISGLFFRLVPYPILEFLYLLPGLFIVAPFVILLNKPKLIHAHGLVAGATGVFWGKIFRIRTIISLHSIYTFPQKGLYRKFTKFILLNADYVLGLSQQSVAEIKSLGVSKDKVINFTYWINLEKFRKISNAKKKLQWEDKFVVLFVGRLIWEKGVRELLKSTLMWNKKITLALAGVGPLEKEVKKYASLNKSILFLGNINNSILPIYYSASDILIIPTIGEEGFGRVIIEALACGLPVIGSNKGAIPEALGSSVGELINISPENIAKTVNHFYDSPQELVFFSKNSRSFVTKRYSEKNANEIVKFYG